MNHPLTIALDAMGGERAPEAVIEGADAARERHAGMRFLLFGHESRLEALLQRFPELAAVTTVRHAEEVVGDEDLPSTALRRARRSSMRLAIDAVGNGEAAGVVSAGNTGAMMAMAMSVLKTLPGVHRPALASIFPSRRGETVLLDLGANPECTAENLVQYAVMGVGFAQTVLGVVKPTVALLNVGTEMTKGNETVRAAAKVLEAGDSPIEFRGFVEGDDITKGTVDVVVTDGFTGNIAVKTAEGTARLCNEFIHAAFRQSLSSRLGYLLAKRALSAFRDRVDPSRYNGGVFLGLNGIAVKSHGASDAFGFSTAIGFAADMSTHGYNAKVTAGLERWRSDQTAEAEASAG